MGKKTDKGDGVNLDFLKKNWSFILLMLIFLLGLYLRSYHIDYPVVGYHNWKEAHYLTEARNFAEHGFFEHGFFVPYRDYWPVYEQSEGAHGDTFPTISIMAAILFKIFGYQLWAARLIGLLFNAFGVLLVYSIIKRLSGKETISLIAAFLMAINPMYVFYSHNVQLMNVGIFFGLLGIYLFLIWKEKNEPKYIILSSLAFTVAGLTKYPFLVMMTPLVFIFPYERLKNLKQDYKQYLISFSIFLLIPIWMRYMVTIARRYGLDKTAATLQSVNFGKIFTSSFMASAKAYVADNFTILGFWLAIGGILVMMILGLKKKTNFVKFIIGYFLGFIVFFFVMGSKLAGHSYHYFPVGLLAISLIAYLFTVIANTVGNLPGQFLKHPVVPIVTKTIVILLLLLLIYNPSMEARNRQFNTQFLGLDVAGNYLATKTAPGERIMHSSHQSYGLLWHGDVTGTRGIPKTVEDMRYAEEELGARWIFMYNWDFGLLQGELGDYIRNNYHLAQFGFQQINNQIRPIYFLFQQGGNFSDEDLNTLANSNPIQTREYEYTHGKTQLLYVSE